MPEHRRNAPPGRSSAPTIAIREATRGDVMAIRQVIERAFASALHASGTEAAIVDGLRGAGKLALSLVAMDGAEIVGHVAFSPVAIGGHRGWFGLGPVAVLPRLQRHGIGSALVREGLDRLQLAGASGCVVLGEPGYYRRFGFRHEAALRLAGVPAEYFMALPLAGTIPAGDVRYHAAFDAS